MFMSVEKQKKESLQRTNQIFIHKLIMRHYVLLLWNFI